MAKSKFTQAQREAIKLIWAEIEKGDHKAALEIVFANNWDINEELEAPEDVIPGEVFNWTLLHGAAYYNQFLCMVQLVLEGADLEKPDELYGSRPLGWAAYMDYFELTSDLVKRLGANVKAKNDGGQTALDLVQEVDNNPWEDLLSEDRQRRSHKKKITPYEAAVQYMEKLERNKVKSENRQNRPSSATRRNEQVQTPTSAGASNLNARLTAHQIKQQMSAVNAGVFAGGMEVVPGMSTQVQSLTLAQRQNYNQQLFTKKIQVGSQQQMAISGQPTKMYIASVGMVSNDDLVRMILPIEANAAFGSQCLTVDSKVKSLNLRLLLRPSPEEPIQYNVVISQTCAINMKFRVEHRYLPVINSTPTVYDTTTTLAEGMNSIEFVVRPVSPITGIQKLPQAFTVFLNRA